MLDLTMSDYVLTVNLMCLIFVLHTQCSPFIVQHPLCKSGRLTPSHKLTFTLTPTRQSHKNPHIVNNFEEKQATVHKN